MLTESVSKVNILNFLGSYKSCIIVNKNIIFTSSSYSKTTETVTRIVKYS